MTKYPSSLNKLQNKGHRLQLVRIYNCTSGARVGKMCIFSLGIEYFLVSPNKKLWFFFLFKIAELRRVTEISVTALQSPTVSSEREQSEYILTFFELLLPLSGMEFFFINIPRVHPAWTRVNLKFVYYIGIHKKSKCENATLSSELLWNLCEKLKNFHCINISTEKYQSSRKFAFFNEIVAKIVISRKHSRSMNKISP